MKRPGPVLLLILALAIASSGCALYGKRLERGTVSKIRPGQTTRAEVEQLLGPPRAATITNGNALTRHFFHGVEQTRDASAYVRRWHPGNLFLRTLTLKYGSNDIVERKLYDESVTPVYRTNAWFFAGPPLTADSVSFIARGTTTEKELAHKLGQPAAQTFDENGRVCLGWFSLKRRVKSWSDLPVQRLIVLVDEGIVREYVLDEYVLSAFRSERKPEAN